MGTIDVYILIYIHTYIYLIINHLIFTYIFEWINNGMVVVRNEDFQFIYFIVLDKRFNVVSFFQMQLVSSFIDGYMSYILNKRFFLKAAHDTEKARGCCNTSTGG